MNFGAITQQIDLAQLLVVAFVLFFFGLVYYIRGEDKREGYPLVEAGSRANHEIVGFPTTREPKTYERLEGSTVTLPQEYERRDLPARPREPFPGAPLYPVGEPLIAGVGPGAYTLRRDEPFVMHDGSPQLEPLRKATDYSCVDPDLDPRGRRVFAADLKPVGRVTDIWIDKGSKILRYIEVAIDGDPQPRLLPIFYANVPRDSDMLTMTVLKAAQVALAPVLKSPDTITAREEDRVNAFFAGGHMYSTPLPDAVL